MFPKIVTNLSGHHFTDVEMEAQMVKSQLELPSWEMQSDNQNIGLFH